MKKICYFVYYFIEQKINEIIDGLCLDKYIISFVGFVIYYCFLLGVILLQFCVIKDNVKIYNYFNIFLEYPQSFIYCILYPFTFFTVIIISFCSCFLMCGLAILIYTFFKWIIDNVKLAWKRANERVIKRR